MTKSFLFGLVCLMVGSTVLAQGAPMNLHCSGAEPLKADQDVAFLMGINIPITNSGMDMDNSFYNLNFRWNEAGTLKQGSVQFSAKDCTFSTSDLFLFTCARSIASGEKVGIISEVVNKDQVDNLKFSLFVQKPNENTMTTVREFSFLKSNCSAY